MPALQQETFEMWKEQDERFKEQVLAHIQTQTQLNLVLVQRVTKVETNQDAIHKRTAIWSSLLAALISGLAGGVAVWK